MSKQDAVFHAFEEWWAITGADMLDAAQAKGTENGIEVSAFAAGAEWMREQCAKQVDDEAYDYTTLGAHVHATVIKQVAERIRAKAGAQ